MTEIPVPRPDELLPMLPGAAVGAIAAWLAARATPGRGLRVALLALAAVAPWWTTWALTHYGAPPLGLGTASERAAVALPWLALGLFALPVGGWRGGLAIVCRALLGAAAAIAVLWTFVDPAHPHAIGAVEFAGAGLVAAIATTPAHLAATRLATPAILIPVAIALAALGLLLLAVGGAAALSQVTAATALAAGVTAVGARAFGPTGMPAGLPAVWIAAGYLAGVDAWRTAATPLPAVSVALLVAAVALPALGAFAPARRRRSVRITSVCIGAAALLAALAVMTGLSGTATDEVERADDPYADFR